MAGMEEYKTKVVKEFYSTFKVEKAGFLNFIFT
jgi:hypothetical protein